MSLLDVLSSVLKRIVDLMPSFLHVAEGQNGLLCTRGKYRVVPPGFHFHWPFWTTAEAYSVNRQAAEVSIIEDGEDQQLLTQVWLVYEISDLYRATVTCHDWEDTLDELVRIAMVTSDGDMRDQIKASLADYGIKLLDFAVNQFQVCPQLLLHKGFIGRVPDDG